MLRFNRSTGRLWEDHSELLRDPNIHAIVGRPKPRAPFRSQQQPMPPAPMPAAPTEDPLTKFRRLVEQLMSKGLSFTESVRFIDSIDPTLRQRSNELATYRQHARKDSKAAHFAAVRANRVRRFNRRGVR